MKVLHVSNKPAYPRIDGGAIAISQLLLGLIANDQTDVTHFTLSTHKHPFDIRNYPTALSHQKIVNFPINTAVSISGALWSLIKNESYNVVRFYDPSVSKKMENYLTEYTFDYVILESIFLLPYTELFRSKGIKVILRAHNVEHHIWEQQAKRCRSFVKKVYFNKLAKQLKFYELSALKAVDGIMVISDQDARYFQSQFPEKPITTIPTSFSSVNETSDYTKNDFYFLGAMDWTPNEEGVDWLLKKVIPMAHSSLKIHLAGKSMNCARLSSTRIHCHGEVDDAKSFILSHGICLIPIQSGSGIKIKLLENMALGKPIITTSEGARGVNVIHDEHVIIADSPKDFVDAMLELNNNTEKRIRLGTAARDFVIDNFGEEIISTRILEFITSI